MRALPVIIISGVYWIGRLRLVEGDSKLDGVVQALINDEWRMVCGQNWNLTSGHEVCKQLGYIGGAVSVRSIPTPTRQLASPTEDTAPVLIEIVPCNTGDPSVDVADCEDNGSSGDDWCSLFEVAWVKCSKPVPLFKEDDDEPMLPEALHMNTEPTAEVQPVVSEIGGGSVTLDWTEWNSKLEVDDFFVIRFLIKYRLADNEAVVEYATSAELPSFITKHTVTGLKDRTKYEFIIEVVRLGSAGEEEVGPVSKPFLVNMPCGAPSQVVNAVLHPKDGTGTAVTVSWTEPSDIHCPATSYVVSYKLKTLGKCDELFMARLGNTNQANTLITTTTETTLEGLHPYSTYIVYVTSRSEHGEGPTWEGTVGTNEDVPSAEPTGISATFFTGTGLRFRWDPIPCNHRGGTITGYTYILLDATTDQVTHAAETVLPRLELMVSPEVRQYKLLVAAKTRLGRGPYAAFSASVQPKITEICGRTIDLHSSESLQRVTRGDTALKGSAPWLAQLWYIKEGTLFCHGSILNDRWILTAAHCIKSRNTTKNNLRIHLGDFDKVVPEKEERAYSVDDIVVHSGFDTKLFDADIALVKVDRTIQFTDYIRPICLPQKKVSKQMLSIGRQGLVSGWGKLTTNDNEYPRYLKKVMLPVQQQAVCKRSTDYQVTPNMFCAGYSRAGMGDSCEGDSGAPFAVQHTNGRWHILGVVSWGEGCDQMNKFGFYVRLHRYTAWIKKQTGLELR
ncbi:uncharacterized protein [Asterias amurensis]|uniref:uncharacterized protein isoform X2 n=1 Tax=Asterias amurensis TaxID=7602 RepID=UPI003AB2FBF9